MGFFSKLFEVEPPKPKVTVDPEKLIEGDMFKADKVVVDYLRTENGVLLFSAKGHVFPVPMDGLNNMEPYKISYLRIDIEEEYRIKREAENRRLAERAARPGIFKF